MPIIEWNQSFATGDERVDAQHRTLFRLINDLHDAMVQGRVEQVMAETLQALERYVVEHFATEAAFMERANYPAAPEHLRSHDELGTKTRELVEQYRVGNLLLGITVSESLARWFVEHIIAEDKPMIEWVRAHITVPDASAQIAIATHGRPNVADDGRVLGSHSRLRVDPAAPSVGQLPIAGSAEKT